ncbi:hypothetical protein GCM10017567_31630 [Amycolatopsis bullii]|uniref:Methyltransferase n=1 Tax=Amycolatopsis bullii TaxID=941987 RepID=A0ABQ3KBR7_9PSEU|nr:hypothetical protein GCM10017567_31630 [Amycolatopsis bullii]
MLLRRAAHVRRAGDRIGLLRARAEPGGRIALLTSARSGRQPARLIASAGGIVSGQKMFDRGEITASLRARGFTEITERYAGVTQIVAGRLG